MLSAREKNFQVLNRDGCTTKAEERMATIEARAKQKAEHIKQVLHQAESRAHRSEDERQRAVEERNEAHAARKRRREAEQLQSGWAVQVAAGSRLQAMLDKMLGERFLRSITFAQTVAVVCMQRRWRLFTLQRTMKRRIAARKVIVRVLVAWTRRLRLKWKRQHAATVLQFLSDVRSMRLTCKAVKQYRHLVVLVQRRVRSYAVMWEARLELAERQFERVQDVMVQQAARARRRLPMSFRRKVWACWLHMSVCSTEVMCMCSDESMDSI